MMKRRWSHSALMRVFPVVGVVCTTPILAGGGPADNDHPVFAKYPSPAELQARIDSFREANPQAFAAARDDFGLAIRSKLGLKGPKAPWYKPPHVRPRGLQLKYRLKPRSSYEEAIANAESRPGGEAVAQFLREHIDDYAVEFTPALRLVVIDVLLNGWDDWSKWEGERLTEYREEFPDLHRAIAVRLLHQIKLKDAVRRMKSGEPSPVDGFPDANGILLRMLVDPELPRYTRKGVQSTVDRISGNFDALRFVVSCALERQDAAVRRSCYSCMQTLSKGVPGDKLQAFWIGHLDSEDDWVRTAAVQQVGHGVLRTRALPIGSDPNRYVVDRLRRIAENDPSDQVRRQARRAVKSYDDDSPPPGLITYEKKGQQ